MLYRILISILQIIISGLYAQPWFWTTIGIIVIIFILLAIVGSLMQTEQSSSNTQQSYNNEANNTQSSFNTNLPNIQWTDISPSEVSGTVVFDEEFLIGRNQNNNLEEQLSNLIGQKDRVSQEIFCAGEKVYFCVNCQLGYHEDSWQYLNQTCEQCKSSNLSMYNLQLTYVRETKQVTFTELFTINADDFFGWGCDKLQRKDYIGAIEYFTEALKGNPNKLNSYEVYLNRAITYYKLKNYNAAIEDYNCAIRINYNNANAYYNRGDVYYRIGNIQQAINDYNQAIRIKPDHAQAKRKLDLARSKLAKTRKVETSSNSSSTTPITTEVNYADYLFRQGIEKIQEKDYIIAIEDFTQALRLTTIDNAKVYYNRGYAYYKLKRYYEAIEDYNRAIIHNYKHANAYTNRGNVYYLLGDMQTAIDDYNHALSINPDNHQAKTNLNLARSKLKKTQQVIFRPSDSTVIYVEEISALDLYTIRRNVTQEIAIKGKIKGVYVDKDNRIIYFYFAENALNGFYVYVSTKSFHKFPDPTSYLETNIVVCGRISLNDKNQPCIHLTDVSQLRKVN